MPVYAYGCQSCGVRFERTQKFTDPPLARCPECRKGRVRRLVQASAIVFKGSGWYATDHRSATALGSSRKDEGSSDTSESTVDTADSQPAGKEKKSIKSDGVTEQGEGRPRAGGSHHRGAGNNRRSAAGDRVVKTE